MGSFEFATSATPGGLSIPAPDGLADHRFASDLDVLADRVADAVEAAVTAQSANGATRAKVRQAALLALKD